MASTGKLIIDRNARVSKEIDRSLELTPLPRGMTFLPKNSTKYDAYVHLTWQEQAQRAYALKTIPIEWANEQPVDGTPAYEASQPPLYYWMMAVVLYPLRQFPLLDRVWVARISSFALGSLCIPIGFLLARRIFRWEAVAISVVSFVALLPELSIDLARVSNESLAIPLFTALVLATSIWIEQPSSFTKAAYVGFLLGCGLLTKAYFLTAVPALMLLVVWALSTQTGTGRFTIIGRAAVLFGIALGMAGWWYVRNLVQTGTLSALDEALMLRNTTAIAKIQGVFHVQWLRAILTIILSHIWYGGWSLLSLPHAIYFVGFIFISLGCFGLLRMRSLLGRPKIFSLLAFYSWFWLGQCYQILMLYLSKGSSTAMGGWYLYAVIWAEVIIWFLGILALPVQSAVGALIILIGSVALLDLYGIHFVAVPYYTHASIYKLQFLGGSIGIASLDSKTIALLWIGYVAATLACVAIAAYALHRSDARDVTAVWS